MNLQQIQIFQNVRKIRMAKKPKKSQQKVGKIVAQQQAKDSLPNRLMKRAENPPQFKEENLQYWLER
jgi:hypothetical protein